MNIKSSALAFVLLTIPLVGNAKPPSSSLPSWMLGSWHGWVTQLTPYYPSIPPSLAYEVNVDVTSTNGNYTYTINYLDLDCSGTLSYVSSSASTAKFTEIINPGDPCVTGGTVIFNKISSPSGLNPGFITYSWFLSSTPNGLGASATLQSP